MRRKYNKHDKLSREAYKNGTSTIVTAYGKVDVEERREDGSIVGRMWKLADDSFAKIYLAPEKRLGPSKKFALIVGYNGEGFWGSQTNPKVRTVERDLERGLYDAGLISRNNFSNGLNLNKIKWSRAARTDKGVHALGNLFVMKLALIENVDYPKLINKHLPKSIRVFKCQRVTKGFSAKNACTDRSYEYLLPVSMLNRSRNPELVASVSDGWETGARFDVGRRTDAEALRCIRSFTCSDPFEMQGSMYVRLCVKGQSFLYNQIRKMVGTALYVVRGIIPMCFMEMSFKAHISTILPKAPAEGLLLRGCHYEYYNETHGKTRGKIDMFESETSQRVREFSENNVYPTMLSTLKSTFLKWSKDTDLYIIDTNLNRQWREIGVRYRYFTEYFYPQITRSGGNDMSGKKRARQNNTKNHRRRGGGSKRRGGGARNQKRRRFGKNKKSM
eukprot:g6822.t1